MRAVKLTSTLDIKLIPDDVSEIVANHAFCNRLYSKYKRCFCGALLYAKGSAGDWNETSQTGVNCPTARACSVQCKATHSYDKFGSHNNIGSCGAGKYSDYLKSEPCTSKLSDGTDDILSLYAGCDYNVCAAACDGLTVDADMPYASTIWHGSLLHCFNVSDSNSFIYKDITQHTGLDSTVIVNASEFLVTETLKSHKALAEEASVALGCSTQGMSLFCFTNKTYALI